MTEEQNKLLELIIEDIMADGVEDLRQMFWSMSKEYLLIKYSRSGFGLFQEFKYIINEKFGPEMQEYLTVELISRIYDRVKWLN